MCGVVFLSGPHAASRIEASVERLRHRGPDGCFVWNGGRVALGFARLEINGVGELGQQPYMHGDLVGAVNGEVYNHRALADAHELAPSLCDAHVVLPLVLRRGPRVIDELDGFYAGVVYRPATGEVLCLRDHIGKKPLFVGRSDGEVFITSELKVFNRIEWFEPLPRGASAVEPSTGEVRLLATHKAVGPRADLKLILEDAVRKRLPQAEQPVGVFLSGGLDSSLVAAVVARHRADATYFTLGDAESADRVAVERVVGALGLKNVRTVALPSRAEIPSLVRRVVVATESFNPSIVSNGLATYVLAAAAREAGIKVVLSGEGADELFGGYHSFRSAGDPWSQVRRQLIDDLHLTELRRLDSASMAHGVEVRCPFLDRELRSFSDGLGFEEFYANGENKVALRRCFEGHLPPEVLHRQKTSFDVGSGVRREVVRYLRRNGRSERDELRDLWRERFAFDEWNPYFHAYPVFDAAIDVRGSGHR